MPLTHRCSLSSGADCANGDLDTTIGAVGTAENILHLNQAGESVATIGPIHAVAAMAYKGCLRDFLRIECTIGIGIETLVDAGTTHGAVLAGWFVAEVDQAGHAISTDWALCALWARGTVSAVGSVGTMADHVCTQHFALVEDTIAVAVDAILDDNTAIGALIDGRCPGDLKLG